MRLIYKLSEYGVSDRCLIFFLFSIILRFYKLHGVNEQNCIKSALLVLRRPRDKYNIINFSQY